MSVMEGNLAMSGEQTESRFLERLDEVVSAVSRWIETSSGPEPWRRPAESALQSPPLRVADECASERPANPIKHWRWE
jgi:hypothetical protein